MYTALPVSTAFYIQLINKLCMFCNIINIYSHITLCKHGMQIEKIVINYCYKICTF